MANNNYENEELENVGVENEDEMSSWRDRFEGQAREYFDEMERTGGDLVHPGRGCVASVRLDSIHSFDVFKRKHNKKVFIEMIRDISDACQTAKLLAYCVLDDTAYLLVKGNRRESAVAFVDFIIKEYTAKYNRGLRSVGNPFRPDYSFRVIAHSDIGAEVNRIHSFSPDGMAAAYPFCSYGYLRSGEHDANLILKLELDPSREDFETIIQGMDGVSVSLPKGVENYKSVKSEIDKKFGHQTLYREQDVGFMISETASRSNSSYVSIAKKKGMEKRYDVLVTSVCSFIMRRGCSYQSAVSSLGINDTEELRMEVIAEINRIHHYSYDYIVTNIMCDPDDRSSAMSFDPDWSLLAKLFVALNEKYGYSYEQLCVRFHVTNNLIYLRQLCGL